MKIISTYKVKICNTHGAFKATVDKYREATDFFIGVVLAEWEYLSRIQSQFDKLRAIELLTHQTANNLNPKYNFDKDFYKFPSYLRRAAITEAIGWFAANYFDAENEEIKEQAEIQNSSKKSSKIKECPKLCVNKKSNPEFTRLSENKSTKFETRSKIKIIFVVVALIIIALCYFYFLSPASTSSIFSKFSLWFWVIPAVLTLAVLRPNGIWKVFKALWKCFKALAGWIGTIPTIIAGIHLWGNDTIFQKLVKGTVSTIGAVLSWLTGYRKGYEKGYQDAQENRKKRWWKVLWPF